MDPQLGEEQRKSDDDLAGYDLEDGNGNNEIQVPLSDIDLEADQNDKEDTEGLLSDFELEGQNQGQGIESDRNKEVEQVESSGCLKFEVNLMFNIGFQDADENLVQNLSDVEHFMKRIGSQNYTTWSIVSHNQKQVNLNLASHDNKV